MQNLDQGLQTFSYPNAPHVNVPNLKDLCNRINCWRLDVDQACTPPPSPRRPTTLKLHHHRGPASSVGMSSATRVRSTARPRPYSGQSPRRPQSFPVIDFHGSSLPQAVVGFGDRHPTGVWTQRQQNTVVATVAAAAVVVAAAAVTAAVLPEEPIGPSDRDSSSGISLGTSSIREVSVGHGLDLPHPERNPLIARHPEIVKEEYYRIVTLFRRLNAERRRIEYLLVQYHSKETRQRLMDIGTTIQHVIAAAQYIVDYSNAHGWDIDFDMLLYDDRVPPVKMLPSKMRELVCSPAYASSPEWHLQPAA